VRKRGGRKRALGPRAPMPVPSLPNDLWALDFVSDQLVSGRRFRILVIYDVCTRRCLAAIADFSLSGKRVANDHVAYSMSKFAVLALTHSTRRIGWDKGVRATAICPSFVRTDMTASTDKIAPEDMIDPADLAELVATVIALPNTASISELLVNCRLEAMV